jgi:acetyl esterase
MGAIRQSGNRNYGLSRILQVIENRIVPVDRETQSLLDAMRIAGGKPLYEQTVVEARERIKVASLQLGVAANDVHEAANRRIPVLGGDVGVRVYTPRPLVSGDALPIVLLYHGGGFVAGDLDTHDSIARFYSTHVDAIVMAVDYRLAPEHPFPAAVDDAYGALVWAAEHARELHGDVNRIAVTGDSAGGNLSAVVCQMTRELDGPRIAYQALVYPVVDFDPSKSYPSRAEFGGGEYFLSNRDMAWFRSLYLTDEPRQVGDLRASPLANTDLAGLPPAVVITSGCDLLRDEGKAYADRLAGAGVPVEYRCFDTTIHACVSFAGAIPTGFDALSYVASCLRKALHHT